MTDDALRDADAERLAQIRMHVKQVSAGAGVDAERARGRITFLLRLLCARDATIRDLRAENARLTEQLRKARLLLDSVSEEAPPLGDSRRTPSPSGTASDGGQPEAGLLEEFLGCARYDATMEGPKFKGWNLSSLNRLRMKLVNETPACQDAGEAAGEHKAESDIERAQGLLNALARLIINPVDRSRMLYKPDTCFDFDGSEALKVAVAALSARFAEGHSHAYARHVKDHRELVDVMYREREAAKIKARAEGERAMRDQVAQLIKDAPCTGKSLMARAGKEDLRISLWEQVRALPTTEKKL